MSSCGALNGQRSQPQGSHTESTNHIAIESGLPVIRLLMPNFVPQSCHLRSGRYYDLRMRVVSTFPCMHL
jgi:hypothetical protein